MAWHGTAAPCAWWPRHVPEPSTPGLPNPTEAATASNSPPVHASIKQRPPRTHTLTHKLTTLPHPCKLSAAEFVQRNLIPATLGNLIGGATLVATSYACSLGTPGHWLQDSWEHMLQRITERCGGGGCGMGGRGWGAVGVYVCGDGWVGGWAGVQGVLGWLG